MSREAGNDGQLEGSSPEMWAWADAAVASCDDDAKIRWASPAFAAILGSSPSALEGASLVQLLDRADMSRFEVFWSDPVRVRREPFAFPPPGADDGQRTCVLRAKAAEDGTGLLLKIEVRQRGELAAGTSGGRRDAVPTAFDASAQAHLQAATAGERIAGMGSWTFNHAEAVLRWSPGAWTLVDVHTEWGQNPPAGDLFDYVTADHLPAVLVWWDAVRVNEGAPLGTSFLARSASGELRLLRISGTTSTRADGSRVSAGAVRQISETADFDQDLHEMLGAMKNGEVLAGMGSWSRELPAGTGVFSDNVYAMLGVPIPPPGGDRTFAIEDWVHPDDMEDVIAAIGPSFWEPMPYRFTTRVITADGSVKFLEGFGETTKVHASDPQPTRTHGSLRDITHEVVAQKAIVTLSRVSRVLAEETDANQMITRICESAVETGGYAFAAYDAVLPGQGGSTRRVAFAGSDRWIAQEHARRVAQVVQTGQVLTLPESQVAGADIEPAATLLPVVVDGELDGVLSLWTADKAAFDFRASNTLANLSADVGRALSRIRSSIAGHQDLLSAMALVTAVLEPRGLTLLSHHARVAALSAAVGAQLGLGERTLQHLRVAALIHDLGKVALPADALISGVLDYPEEQMLLDRHPEIGRDLAARFPWSFPLPQILLQHHESWDGSGEPGQLAGDAIRIEARIVRVADTYVTVMEEGAGVADANAAFAAATVAAGGGRMFDPQVTDALLRVIDDGFAFPRTATHLFEANLLAGRRTLRSSQ